MRAGVLRTVLVEILGPIAVYLALTAGGLAPAWALAVSAGVSVAVLLVGWARTREASTLGLLVLVRFGLGLAVASLTGDARFVLVKDYVITLVLALVALATLGLDRPFIARVRRDLSPDRERFDREWARNAAFRRVHRRLTGLWVGGLIAEVAVAVAVVYTAPLTVAVIVTGTVTPVVLLTLIALTEVRARRTTAAVPLGAADPSDA